MTDVFQKVAMTNRRSQAAVTRCSSELGSSTLSHCICPHGEPAITVPCRGTVRGSTPREGVPCGLMVRHPAVNRQIVGSIPTEAV